MSTTLAATAVEADQADLLSLIADEHTAATGKPFADAFRDACEHDALLHDGWVHPSRVNAILHDALGDFDPRRFSASWAPACGPNGFLDKTEVWEPIDPTYSDGNANKSVRLRRWRVLDTDFGWREHGLSDCEYGCKVYRHPLAEPRVMHHAVYGCPRGVMGRAS